MHIAVFGSGSGTILQAMLAAKKTSFSIRLLFTDKECGFQSIAKKANIPLIYHPKNQSESKEEYDRKGLQLLQQFSTSNECPIDCLLLAGYMRIMSSVWLQAFPFRIINIHPADLSQLDSLGNRLLIGANAVYKALELAHPKTRTCSILVDDSIDGGPVVTSGPWVEYRGGMPVTVEKAKEHQELQKRLIDWPTCLNALELIAEGRIGCDFISKKVFLDGKPLPPCGYETPNEVQHVWNHRNSGP